MIFEKIKARDGNASLKVNNILLYSKYRPLVEVDKFIESEFDNNAKGYLLIGLGLGYHLHSLAKIVYGRKPILVYALDKKEIELYKSEPFQMELPDSVIITTDIEKITVHTDYQIIIPHVWLQVMEKKHALYSLLMDIKVKQMSYKRFSPVMEKNFQENIQQHFLTLRNFKDSLNKKKVSCLISSGPSLNFTKAWLKAAKGKAYLLCVGSALKVLLKEGIVPDGVIISDCQPIIFEQLKNTGFTGDLFFLSTADFNTVKSHVGNKYILLQEGYDLAEQYAKKISYPLIETGGSVATTGFSLLEYLEFETVILFGQDLGLTGNQTHANNSTSGREILKEEELVEIESNDGESIKTLPNLNSYLRWFNYKCKISECYVYNTAKQGAKIEGVPLISEKQFYKLIKNP
ncbi:motility associated factor glycosyltransferase family protein [Lysinibacillus sp. 54212]|uniref:motility associated factor glycosyltransferase family protein n=1 Tax=Lysinibacillus sp. 54212 TaxID=3119829 RepID=UPI002FCC0C41